MEMTSGVVDQVQYNSNFNSIPDFLTLDKLRKRLREMSSGKSKTAGTQGYLKARLK
jgi:hypothetical protein